MCSSLVSCISCIVFIAIIAALGLALGLYYGYFDEQDIADATGIDVPSLPPFFFNDPFEGVPQESTAKWANSGSGGLALTIVDYTSDDWQGALDTAISDWDNGTPDALTLSTQNLAFDQTCEFEDGVMIVCNDDYGETGWKGLNEYQVTPNNIIVNSRAKMNEYYLAGASQEERQYVMCHEIGKHLVLWIPSPIYELNVSFSLHSVLFSQRKRRTWLWPRSYGRVLCQSESWKLSGLYQQFHTRADSSRRGQLPSLGRKVWCRWTPRIIGGTRIC